MTNGTTGSDDSDTRLKPLAKDDLKNIVEETISAKLKYYKALTIAFLAGLTLLIGLGLIGGPELIRQIHNRAFPPHLSDQVAVAYESSLELKASDPQRQSQSISFWSTPSQRVDLFAQAFQTSQTTGSEARRIVISVDGNKLTSDPVNPDEISAAFHDITTKLRKYADLSESPDIHKIIFSLDDTQRPEDLRAKVIISTLVLVRGAEK